MKTPRRRLRSVRCYSIIIFLLPLDAADYLLTVLRLIDLVVTATVPGVAI